MNDDEPILHLRKALQSLGLSESADPELARTPERFVKMLRDLFSEMHAPPPVLSTFEQGGDLAASDGEPVFLLGLPFKSMCVHHLLPFFGTIDVAIVPGEQLVGFGSVGRVIDHFARRPQVQERLVQQVAGFLEGALHPKGVLVRCTARQLCMEMRGASKAGKLISLASRGCLLKGELRNEALRQFTTERGSL